jgi:hypothetical protein
MSYFKQFPKTRYDFERSGLIQDVVDIHRSVRPIKAYLDDITEYKFYTIRDGERPDIVSLSLYGNAEYYWTFFAVNDFLSDGSGAWPMSQQQLNKYFAANMSGRVAVTQPTINYDADNNITDYEDNINIDAPNDYTNFTIGEIVQNADPNGSPLVAPSATGTLTRINVDMNQLTIKPITGSFTTNDGIWGLSSGKFVRAYIVYDETLAPFYYYSVDDAVKRRPTSCPEFFGDTSDENALISTMPYVSNRAHIIAQNDDRMHIRIISPNFIERFVDKYMRLINE